MKYRRYLNAAFLICIIWTINPVCLKAATSLSQHGINWTFDRDYQTGTFVTGDYWVVGPIKIIGISTDMHTPGFQPGPDDDGSMVNPAADGCQGYDGSLSSYRAELNAGRPGGRPITPENPLILETHSSLVSMTSWLYTSPQNKEPGIPGFNGTTKAPRPVTRSGAILTVLPEAPPKGSFRPPYCGNDKTVKFNVADLDLTKLRNLTPPENTPDPKSLAAEMSRPWIDHVHEFSGAMLHPSENMPNYGRDMSKIVTQMSLLAQLDFSKLPGSPNKLEVVIPLVQYGIDSTGIADVGGGWPENGGHGLGRKFPILFAGALLGDRHMLDVGQWKTRFQDDEQTFYVTQESVDITSSKDWDPDRRAKNLEPYETKDIGTAEWGVRHTMRPTADNRGWQTPYRDINGSAIPGYALAASMMDLRKQWNHEAYFDYAVRFISETKKRGRNKGTNLPPFFVQRLWDLYHKQFGLTN